MSATADSCGATYSGSRSPDRHSRTITGSHHTGDRSCTVSVLRRGRSSVSVASSSSPRLRSSELVDAVSQRSRPADSPGSSLIQQYTAAPPTTPPRAAAWMLFASMPRSKKSRIQARPFLPCGLVALPQAALQGGWVGERVVAPSLLAPRCSQLSCARPLLKLPGSLGSMGHAPQNVLSPVEPLSAGRRGGTSLWVLRALPTAWAAGPAAATAG